MAQTTRFASFGPVLLVVASSVSIRSTVAPRVLVDKNELKKKHDKKKKTRTNGPNDANRVVWARSLRRRLP